MIHVLQAERKIECFKAASGFALATAIPPLIAFIYFKQFQPTSEALRAVGWAWVPLLTSEVAKNRYYEWCMQWTIRSETPS